VGFSEVLAAGSVGLGLHQHKQAGVALFVRRGADLLEPSRSRVICRCDRSPQHKAEALQLAACRLADVPVLVPATPSKALYGKWPRGQGLFCPFSMDMMSVSGTPLLLSRIGPQ
jgi:hypothetical protein